MPSFEKTLQGLKKTSQLLNTDVRDLFKAEGWLVDDVLLDGLLGALTKIDIDVRAAQAITNDCRSQFLGRIVQPDVLTARIKQTLKDFNSDP